MANSIELKPVAFVKNMRNDMSDDHWGNVLSEITLVDELPEEALHGIETFSHLEIIYHFNKADDDKIVLSAAHPRENKAWPKVGIFAQRKKDRPNHIGTTIAKFVSRTGKTIIVSHLDADDGTPVLDIKPVVKEFLPQGEVIQPGWISELMRNYWK
jgi:tRNA-Thr(GGU) m(6)t(6)A37 methyltransferase TsaA